MIVGSMLYPMIRPTDVKRLTGGRGVHGVDIGGDCVIVAIVL